MSGGIAPRLLAEQVRNTAAWALEGPAGGAEFSWRASLLGADALEATWQLPEARGEYLALLLAAHHATVGTFVPTDVDARIRHHAWAEAHGRDALAALARVVDATDAWDPRRVSARVVEVPGHAGVSGHDGEWLGVRAGALGRAIQARDEALAESVAARIDAELAREAAVMLAVARARGAELDALRVATVLAHNAGDLSRVVEAWPAKGPAADAMRARFVKLGHEGPSRYDGAFVLAGHVNKAVMAAENHRFLPLRKPRGLRRSRDLLLPIGPFFDAWGELVARHRALDDADRGAVLAALVEGHEGDPSQQGYLRAIAGLHRAHPGGVESLAREVPARLRKLLAAGPVRDALRLDPDRFAARLVNRYRAALASYAG